MAVCASSRLRKRSEPSPSATSSLAWVCSRRLSRQCDYLKPLLPRFRNPAVGTEDDVKDASCAQTASPLFPLTAARSCRVSNLAARNLKWSSAGWRTAWAIGSASIDAICQGRPISCSRRGGRSCSSTAASGIATPDANGQQRRPPDAAFGWTSLPVTLSVTQKSRSSCGYLAGMC